MSVQFGSYLIFTYGLEITTSLTVPAATRAKSAPWDEKLHCAKSLEDESLNQLVSIADEMDWLQGPQEAPVILKPPEKQRYQSKLNVTFQFDPDTSSIATFHQRDAKNASKSGQKFKVLQHMETTTRPLQPIAPEITRATATCQRVSTQRTSTSLTWRSMANKTKMC